MPLSSRLEVAVAFQKFRNIDVLSQGLYYIDVSADVDKGGPRGRVVSMLSSAVQGRQGRHVHRPTDAREYPPAEHGEHVASTKVFSVRYVEQVEVLSEVVRFSLTGDALRLLSDGGDTVVLTFDLWHCMKVKMDKRKRGVWQRQLRGGQWEEYEEKAAARLSQASSKGASTVAVTHKGQQVVVDLSMSHAGVMHEMGPQPGERTAVRLGCEPITRRLFKKVATRQIPIRFAALPRAEWLPVTWDNWFFGVAPVLVHTSGVVDVQLMGSIAEPPRDVAKLGDTTPSSPSAQKPSGKRKGDIFSGVVVEGQDASNKLFAAFRVVCSYVSYAYFSLSSAFEVHSTENHADDILFVGARVRVAGVQTMPELNGEFGTVVCRQGVRWGVRFDKEGFGEKALRGRRLTLQEPDAVGTPTVDAAVTEGAQLLSGFRATPPPPRADGRRTPSETASQSSMLRETETGPVMTLACDRVDTSLRSSGAAQWVNHHLTPEGRRAGERLAASSSLAARQATSEMERAVRQQISSGTDAVAAVVANLRTLSAAAASEWDKCLSQRGMILSAAGASRQTRWAKRAFWRDIRTRTRQLVIRSTPQTGTVEDDLRSQVFCYPKCTNIRWEPLGPPDGFRNPPTPPDLRSEHGSPVDAAMRRADAGLGGGSDDSSSGFGSDCSDQEPLSRAAEPRARRRQYRAHTSGHADPERQPASPRRGTFPHLVVFVHGWKGNQYDMGTLRNLMALYLPSGMELHCAKSLEEYPGETIDELAERLAAEVLQTIQSQCSHPRRISFVGHSMGTIVIRAALHSKLLEPYLPLLWTYISLSGPHLGVLRGVTQVVGGALACIARTNCNPCISQLRLDSPYLHALSARDRLGLFRQCVFFASDRDHFVPRSSAALDADAAAYCGRARGGLGSSSKSAVAGDILRNMNCSLGACCRVKRYAVHFDPVGRRELTQRLDRVIGKSVHIAFTVNPDFVHSLLCIFRSYFD